MKSSEQRGGKRIAGLKQEFDGLPDWDARYRHIIEKGKLLAALADSERNENNKVRGCQSQVWLVADIQPDGSVNFRADSDAMIVKGLVAVLLQVYSGLKPEEILATSPQFLKDLGFAANLSPSRANGLFAMVKQIFYFAAAFQAVGKK